MNINNSLALFTTINTSIINPQKHENIPLNETQILERDEEETKVL